MIQSPLKFLGSFTPNEGFIWGGKLAFHWWNTLKIGTLTPLPLLDWENTLNRKAMCSLEKDCYAFWDYAQVPHAAVCPCSPECMPSVPVYLNYDGRNLYLCLCLRLAKSLENKDSRYMTGFWTKKKDAYYFKKWIITHLLTGFAFVVIKFEASL